MIALITPTGGRERQIEYAARWMRNQTYKGEVLWVIVDDCFPSTIDVVPANFRKGWEIMKLRPQPYWKPGMNTQSRNLRIGLSVLKGRKIEYVFIIEDDDYYKPNYLEKMLEHLEKHMVVGEMNTIYYNIPLQSWINHHNQRHCSLFQTAFHINYLKMFEGCCTNEREFIDCRFFRLVKNAHIFYEGTLSVGMKGLAGRAGIGMGHRLHRDYKKDPNFEKLKELLGNDYKYYINE